MMNFINGLGINHIAIRLEYSLFNFKVLPNINICIKTKCQFKFYQIAVSLFSELSQAQGRLHYLKSTKDILEMCKKANEKNSALL